MSSRVLFIQLEKVRSKFLRFASHILKMSGPFHDCATVTIMLGPSYLAQRGHAADFGFIEG